MNQLLQVPSLKIRLEPVLELVRHTMAAHGRTEHSTPHRESCFAAL
jgi:hypothetical protein